MKKLRKAVLPVAGFGTRVLPATKTIPKEMLPVVDRPALQYVVDEAREAGIEHFVFVTGRNKGAIEDYFDRAYELEYSLQAKGKTEIYDALDADTPEAGTMSFVRQQSAKGLGHAICARVMLLVMIPLRFYSQMFWSKRTNHVWLKWWTPMKRLAAMSLLLTRFPKSA